MPDDTTLLAYLVPKLTSQVENAATDALGYILNKSDASLNAMNGLLREGGFEVPPIARMETQVAYEDGAIPDMTGYDQDNVKRLLVESKFWAALLKGQASSYIHQFDQPGPAVLLFIAPNIRIETLWAEIVRQMAQAKPRVELESVGSSDGLWSAMAAGCEKRLMLVSWDKLLHSMADSTSDEGVKADIRQLRGLTLQQDSEAFLPIGAGELNPDLARRNVGYNRLVNDVVDARGVPEEWMNTKGLRATPQWYGYGRYFRFAGTPREFWFGVNHDLWASVGDTPLWLWGHFQASLGEISGELNVRPTDDREWVPIHPKLGVEYSEVLDDVVSQLKTIGKIVEAKLPAE